MLGVGQHIHFAKQGAGTGNVIVPAPGDDRPPAAPGNVGKTDMIACPVAAEEKGYPERYLRWQVGSEFGIEFRQIGGVEAERQGVLFRDVEIGLQGVSDKG